MSDQGMSKKASIMSSCVSGVLGMATKADDPLPFAIIIASMFVLYLIAQGVLDWLKK